MKKGLAGKIAKLYNTSQTGRALVVIAALVAVLGCSCILSAYLSDADTAANVITIGGVNSEIVEEFDPPDELAPGVSFRKAITVKNNGPGSAYVRVKAAFTDEAMEALCTVDVDEENWVYNDEDGYYYYIYPLEEGESTPQLFKDLDDEGNTVKISDDADAAVLHDFDILVYCESLQVGDFANYEEAWETYKANIDTADAGIQEDWKC